MDRNNLLEMLDQVKEGASAPSFQQQRIVLIDGLNLFFRNFAMLNFVNQNGAHIGGLGGFLRSLGTLINTLHPTELYVVFDGVGSTQNRKNLVSEYKSNRNITRITNWDIFEDLEEENSAKIDQISRLTHYLKCLPVKTVILDKLEADDIIAYLSKKFVEKYDSKVFIVSSDKDFIQLINDNITVYRPIEKDFYTKDTVKQKFGILPENFILYKTLIGDNSDNIRGIKGIGSKGVIKRFPQMATEVMSLDHIIDIATQKHKTNVVYARIAHEEDNLRKTYKVMDLHNPMLSSQDETYLDELIKIPTPKLESQTFLKFYHQDDMRHLIKNVEFWINNTFKTLNSYNNDVIDN